LGRAKRSANRPPGGGRMEEVSSFAIPKDTTQEKRMYPRARRRKSSRIEVGH